MAQWHNTRLNFSTAFNTLPVTKGAMSISMNPCYFQCLSNPWVGKGSYRGITGLSLILNYSTSTTTKFILCAQI